MSTRVTAIDVMHKVCGKTDMLLVDIGTPGYMTEILCQKGDNILVITCGVTHVANLIH